MNGYLIDTNVLSETPPEGYPPVAGGTLDLQTAWLTLLGRILGVRVKTPSLTSCLEWSRSEITLHKLTTMDAELKARGRLERYFQHREIDPRDGDSVAQT